MNDQLIKSVADVFSVPAGGVILTILLALCCWIWMRTGTLSVIFNRVWRLMIGDIAKDTIIGKAMEQHLTLMAFKCHHFPDVTTTREAERLVDWIEKNDEELGAVSSCGPYFDVKELTLNTTNIPTWKGMSLRTLFIAAAAVVTMIAGISMVPNEALIRYNPSGSYFWLGEDRARSFNSTVKLTTEQCVDKKFAENAPSGELRATLCELLGDPKKVKQHLAILPLQRFALLVVALCAGLPGISVFYNFSQVASAAKLAKRLKARAVAEQAAQTAGAVA